MTARPRAAEGQDSTAGIVVTTVAFMVLIPVGVGAFIGGEEVAGIVMAVFGCVGSVGGVIEIVERRRSGGKDTPHG